MTFALRSKDFYIIYIIQAIVYEAIYMLTRLLLFYNDTLVTITYVILILII